ncbi:MAG: hypothetical protein Q8P22_04075 [Chloroflexota bacterium]|nr:hypothetical protein [Chloroflexota bacterium]
MSSLKLLGEPAGGGLHQATHLAAQGDALAGSIRLGASPNNTLQDSGGTDRITLATASPHLTLGGNVLLLTSRLAVGTAAYDMGSLDTSLLVKGTAALGQTGIKIEQGLTRGLLATETWGLGGLVNWGNATASLVAGLNFQAYWTGLSGYTLTDLAGIVAYWSNYGLSGSTLTNAKGLWIPRPIGFTGRLRPTNCYGVYVDALISSSGAASSVPTLVEGIHLDDLSPLSTIVPATVIGLRIADITYGINKYMLYLGGATPYLTLKAGPIAANSTPLYLAEGTTPTLRQVQWKAGNTLGAGDRVMVLV